MTSSVCFLSVGDCTSLLPAIHGANNTELWRTKPVQAAESVVPSISKITRRQKMKKKKRTQTTHNIMVYFTPIKFLTHVVTHKQATILKTSHVKHTSHHVSSQSCESSQCIPVLGAITQKQSQKSKNTPNNRLLTHSEELTNTYMYISFAHNLTSEIARSPCKFIPEKWAVARYVSPCHNVYPEHNIFIKSYRQIHTVRSSSNIHVNFDIFSVK